VAVIAHHSKGEDVAHLARVHRAALSDLRIVATRAAGWILADLGLEVDPLGAAADGGVAQIGAMVLDGAVDAVVVLRGNPMPAGVMIGSLVSLCDVCDVPLATNRVTAGILLRDMARRSWADRGRISHPSVLSAYRFPWDPPARRIPEAE
jgi:methylglyoxal synthase